jgi:hypothetical protein
VPTLELTEEEARELSTALEIRIHGLRAELAAADAREYRAELRRTLDRVERIAAHLTERLGGLEAGSPVAAPV